MCKKGLVKLATTTTIKQLATTCGVSPQAISKLLKKLELYRECSKVGNRLAIPETVANQIYEYYGVKVSEVGNEPKPIDNSNNRTETIEALKSQIEAQATVIANLSATNDNLSRLLGQQQMLSLDLQHQLDEARQPFLKRLFNRRKELPSGELKS